MKKMKKLKEISKKKKITYSYFILPIFILSILIRIYNDPTIPYHYDPGKNIVYSRAILDSFPLFPQYNQYFNLGEYYDYQVLFPYLVALFHEITGLSLVTLTAGLAIIIGSFLVVTVYLLTMEMFNNVVISLISATLISVSKIQLFSYMNYYPQILGLTLLPLPFIFIIRYTRNSENKNLVYASIMSAAIILSSYIAGIVYLSILLISLVIYSILRKTYKYIDALAIIIIETLLLLSFYILPIINRSDIETFISVIISAIFTKKDIPFTNPDLVQNDTGLFKIFGFLAITVLVIAISLIIYLSNRKYRERKLKFKDFEILDKKIVDKKDKLINRLKYEHILLISLISIPLILVESYKFRPILWVDRYIEFLDLGISILAGYSIYFILKYIKNKFGNIDDINGLNGSAKAFSIVILVLVFSYPSYEVVRHQYSFGHWDTQADLDTLNYIQNNISPNSLFATPSGITSFWVSALGGVHVLGGESSQILGDRFDGNSYSDIIINSPNVEEKMNLIRKYGVQYIYLTIRSIEPMLWRNSYNSEGLKAFNNPKYFELAYSNKGYDSVVYVLKVKEDLKPRYNQIDANKVNSNKKVTIFGYIMSMTTLIVSIISIFSDEKN